MNRLQSCLCLFAVSMMTLAMPSFGNAETPSETTLYSFGASSTDGVNPFSSLISDAAGNLYGTTAYGGSIGGSLGGGTVFEIAAGTNAETVLYTFGANSTDGQQPEGSLISDAAGNLYGTTKWGGAYGAGTVFEIAAGTHTESVLYSFGANSTDGQLPLAGLNRDAQGNLYGTTSQGGASGAGTVFEIAAGTHAESVLYSFAGGTDGEIPQPV